MKVCELIKYLQNCNENAEVQVFYEADNPLSDPSLITNVLQISNIAHNEHIAILQIN